MRAAQNIGVEIHDQCPVCGESNLRLVKYVYGDKLKQANGRAISNTPSWPSWAPRATSSPVTTSRSASTAGGTTCGASRSTGALPRAESSAGFNRPPARWGTASSTRRTTTRARARPSPSLRGPTTRARRRRAGRYAARCRGSRSCHTPDCATTPTIDVVSRWQCPGGSRTTGTTLVSLPGAVCALDCGGAVMAASSPRMTAPGVLARKGAKPRS